MTRITKDRILNRLSRELVGRLGLPPSLCAYRFLRSVSPESFDYRLIHQPSISRVPLPCNITSRDALSRQDDGWGFSFFDVPERPVAPTFIATVPNCRILAVPDEWGDRHYVILAEGRQLRLRGTGYEPKLHASLVNTKSAPRLVKASWILELWDQNYSHWLTYHLVKVVLLQWFGPCRHHHQTGSPQARTARPPIDGTTRARVRRTASAAVERAGRR
jgi:hypothetical protein